MFIGCVCGLVGFIAGLAVMSAYADRQYTLQSRRADWWYWKYLDSVRQMNSMNRDPWEDK